MTDTNKVSRPAKEWEYRGLKCRIYVLGDIKQTGFVQVGDTWKEVCSLKSVDINMTNRVERKADSMISQAFNGSDNNSVINIPDDGGAYPRRHPPQTIWHTGTEDSLWKSDEIDGFPNHVNITDGEAETLRSTLTENFK